MKILHNISKLSIIIDGKLIKASTLAHKLLNQSNLEHSFSIGKMFYFYSPEIGIYEKINEDQIHQAILLFLVKLDLHPYVTKNYITDTAWFLQALNRENKQITYDYLAFKNGVLRLKDMKLLPYSPELVCLSRINSDYEPTAEPIVFQQLMDFHFEKDAQKFIKAYLRSALLGDNRSQIFLYILGPGGTGKSTFVNILTMVVGHESTLTTTFRDLSQDRFEGINLIGKRLICINDTESFKGDISVVKAITGGDSIIGREKHKSGSYEVIPRGLMIVTGNNPLQTRDVSGAISRRLRVLPMTQKPKPYEIKPLLYKVDNNWEGPLVEESGAIVKWCNMDLEEAYRLLVDISLTPSLCPAQQESLAVINPISEWIRELNIGPEEKCYIGVIPVKQDYVNLVNVVQSKLTLYPAYLIFCHKRGMKPLNHTNFSNDLIMSCNSLDITISKGKDRNGAYIEGLSVNLENVLNSDASGDSLSSSRNSSLEDENKGQNQTKNHPQGSYPLEKGFKPSTVRPVVNVNKSRIVNNFTWNTRNEKLYVQYYELLSKTQFKENLNEQAKDFNPNLDSLINEHVGLLSGLEDLKVEGLEYDFGKPSQDYIDNTKIQFERGLEKIHKQLIPYKYKPMGLSPRILPQGYGDSFNSVKRSLREKAYEFITKQTEDYVILDIDLKSCYTAILLGLFPVELYTIKQAIEGEGLWKFIEKEFQKSKRTSLYNKKAVKICVYSSFFCGGPRAMVNGTLDFMRKEIGLTPAEFRKADFYEPLHALARDVSEFMNQSSVIQDFRRVSGYISKDFDGSTIKGPTRHEYMINEGQFQSSYPNFLQSFEFYLLAQSTIMTIPHFNAHLIGHFHDGNVVIISKQQADDYIELMNENLDKLRIDLTLKYPQVVEVKYM